jgi:hypothetical protein
MNQQPAISARTLIGPDPRSRGSDNIPANRGNTVENTFEIRRLTYGPEVGLYVQRAFGQ